MTALANGAQDAARLGVHRSLDPPGALPHIARVLDPRAPINTHEAEFDGELLAIDAERGKLQNPWTGSGGVALGRVRALGDRYHLGAYTFELLRTVPELERAFAGANR